MNPNPMDLLMSWLEEERTAGESYAQHAILSTSGVDGHPHGRVVAIRELQSEGLIFFTQKGSRNVLAIRLKISCIIYHKVLVRYSAQIVKRKRRDEYGRKTI